MRPASKPWADCTCMLNRLTNDSQLLNHRHHAARAFLSGVGGVEEQSAVGVDAPTDADRTSCTNIDLHPPAGEHAKRLPLLLQLVAMALE